MKLTKKTIDAAKYNGKEHRNATYSRCVLWDHEVSGFGLRVLPSGRKVFVLKYRARGRSRMMTIGRYGPLTLEQAREKAKRLVVEILDGKDPLEAKAKENNNATVADLCDMYMERHAKPDGKRKGKKSWKLDQWRINRYILPAWRTRRVDSVRRSDVSDLMHRISKDSIYEANNTCRLISSMFNKAKEWGLLDDTARNPAKGIPKFKEVKRDRWLSPDEVRRLIQAVDACPSVFVRVAIWLYLLTALRKSELLKARWEHIDWEKKQLQIPDTKAGRKHFVPLTDVALEILRDLVGQSDQSNPYIIPGAKKGRPLTNFSKPWKKIREQAELEDVRLHDLRRTVASWMGQSGETLLVIQHVLNHTTQTATLIYARLGQEPTRKALEKHTERVLAAAGKRQPAEVVQFGDA